MVSGATLLLLLQSRGSTPPTVDHRTLYARAVTRKPTTAIDPTKTVAARK